MAHSAEIVLCSLRQVLTASRHILSLRFPTCCPQKYFILSDFSHHLTVSPSHLILLAAVFPSENLWFNNSLTSGITQKETLRKSTWLSGWNHLMIGHKLHWPPIKRSKIVFDSFTKKTSHMIVKPHYLPSLVENLRPIPRAWADPCSDRVQTKWINKVKKKCLGGVDGSWFSPKARLSSLHQAIPQVLKTLMRINGFQL